VIRLVRISESLAKLSRLGIALLLICTPLALNAGEFEQKQFPTDPEIRKSLPMEVALNWLQRTPKQYQPTCSFQPQGVVTSSGSAALAYTDFRVTNVIVRDEGNRGPMIDGFVKIEHKDGDDCWAMFRRYWHTYSNTHILGPLSSSDLPKLVRDVTRTLEALSTLGVDISEAKGGKP